MLVHQSLHHAESDSDAKTTLGFIGGALTLIAGWFGWRKQKAATKQAEVEAETKKKQIDSDNTQHSQDIEERKEDRLERLIISVERANDTISHLQDRITRIGEENLTLRDDIAKLRVQAKVNCIVPDQGTR